MVTYTGSTRLLLRQLLLRMELAIMMDAESRQGEWSIPLHPSTRCIHLLSTETAHMTTDITGLLLRQPQLRLPLCHLRLHLRTLTLRRWLHIILIILTVWYLTRLLRLLCIRLAQVTLPTTVLLTIRITFTRTITSSSRWARPSINCSAIA